MLFLRADGGLGRVCWPGGRSPDGAGPRERCCREALPLHAPGGVAADVKQSVSRRLLLSMGELEPM